jgi:hypothetical protein
MVTAGGGAEEPGVVFKRFKIESAAKDRAGNWRRRKSPDEFSPVWLHPAPDDASSLRLQGNEQLGLQIKYWKWSWE